MTTAHPKVKVRIITDGRTETLWAEALPDGMYKLLNIPFFSALYALHDIVECEDSEDAFPQAVRVVNPSGNRTRPAVRLGEWSEGSATAIVHMLKDAGIDSEGMNLGGAHFRSFLIRNDDERDRLDDILKRLWEAS